MITVLLTIFEGKINSYNTHILGRNFSISEAHNRIFAQCKFNNEILVTDPVTPDQQHGAIFDTELAFEMSEKTLKYYRSQREMMKVQVFGISSDGSTFEALNMKRHLIGYVMVDLRVNFKEKWHPLIVLKGNAMGRPELKLSFSVEDHDKQSSSPLKTVKNPYPNFGLYPGYSHTKEDPIYLVASGAPNTFDIVRKNDAEHDSSPSETYAVHITIKPASFTNIGAERVGFVSSVGYFFYLKTPVLSENNKSHNSIVSDTFYNLNDFAPISFKIILHGTQKDLKDLLEACPFELFLSRETEILSRLRIHVHKKETWTNYELLGIDSVLARVSVGTEVKLCGSTDQENEAVALATSMALQKSKILPHWHKLRFSIDLKQLSDLTQQLEGVYLRFKYEPLIGIAMAEGEYVQTYPPIFAYENTDNFLPHSMHSFEFCMDLNVFYNCLESVALKIDLFCSLSTGNDEPFARTEILMNSLRSAVKDHIVGLSNAEEIEGENLISNAFKPYQQRVEGNACFYDLIKKESRPLCQLKYFVILEDFGEVGDIEYKRGKAADAIQESDRVLTELFKSSTSKTPQFPLPKSDKQDLGTVSKKRVSIRKTKEYSVAVKLEEWKLREWNDFKKNLEESEKALLSNFAEHAQKTVSQSNSVLQAKLEQLRHYEQQISLMLKKLEGKEKDILEKESAFEAKTKSMESEYQKRLVEVNDSSRHLKDEYESKLERQRVLLDELSSELSSLKNENASLKEHLEELKAAQRNMQEERLSNTGLNTLKEQKKIQEKMEMEAEMNDLKREKAELADRIANLEKTKNHYKDAWKKSMKELLVKKMQKSSEQEKQLLQSIHETEQLRVRFMDLKEEELQAPTPKGEQHTKKSPKPDFKKLERERLQREKRILLSSGVYTPQDQVIQLLDSRLKDLLTS